MAVCEKSEVSLTSTVCLFFTDNIIEAGRSQQTSFFLLLVRPQEPDQWEDDQTKDTYTILMSEHFNSSSLAYH